MEERLLYFLHLHSSSSEKKLPKKRQVFLVKPRSTARGVNATVDHITRSIRSIFLLLPDSARVWRIFLVLAASAYLVLVILGGLLKKREWTDLPRQQYFSCRALIILMELSFFVV